LSHFILQVNVRERHRAESRLKDVMHSIELFRLSRGMQSPREVDSLRNGVAVRFGIGSWSQDRLNY
jgi:hypothetical protein